MFDLDLIGGSWGRFLLDHAVRMTLLLGLAWLAVWRLRRASAATRHLVWTVAVLGCLALPAAALFGPRVVTDRLPDPGRLVGLEREPAPAVVDTAPARSLAEVTFLEESATPVTEPAPPVRGWVLAPDRETVLLTVWLAGAALALLGFATAAWRWRGVVAESGPLGPEWTVSVEEALGVLDVDPERVRFVESDEALPPGTSGLLRPVVVLPSEGAEWPAERRRDAVLHELAHVRRGDVTTQAAANLAVALFWFHPLVWWAAQRMLVERERACDDAVLESGSRASDYAASLLEIARSLGAGFGATAGGLAMARRSEISGRLLAVIDPDRDRRRVTPRMLTAAAFLLVLAVAPLSSLALRGAPAGHDEPFETLAAADPTEASRDWTLDEIRAVVDEANRAIEKGIARRDPEACARWYSQDVRNTSPGVPTRHGRRELEEVYAAVLERGFDRLRIRSLELTRIDATTVLERGTYEYDHDSGDFVLNGRYLSVWRLEDGRWRIYRGMTNV